MKFISSSDNVENVDHKEVSEISLNKLGRPIDEDSERVFAKMLIQNSADKQQTRYAILTFNNQPYDPYGVDSHRESNLNLNIKQVSQQTYNYYVSYLKTKNQLYFTRSQRSFING
jgi:hypothetical protein